MDTYLEYLVKQKYTPLKILLIIGVYLLAGVLSFLSFFIAARKITTFRWLWRRQES